MSAAVPAPSSPSDLHAWLVEAARVEGFPLAGGVDIDRALEGPFPAHVRKYDEWLRAGHAGAMSYLERGRDRRADPRQVFGPAQSVFSVAVPYHPQPVGATDPAVGPRYARYVRGADYHHDLAERLDRALAAAAARLREATGRELAWKICVDTSAVLERSWAALAGLGWIGKNTLLIHPQHGSYLFIAEALVSEKLDRGPAPLPNYCGNCTRCLDACPTGAFLAPRVLDANRCLSYWTLEKRGELELSVTDARAVGTWVAGCDLCQEVCPFNFKAARSPGPVPPASGPDAGEWPLGWEAHLRETEVAYRARIKRSALSRVKPAQFRRNLALALANAAASAEEPSAFARLRPLIEERLATEPDDVARSGWRECLRSIPE